MQEVDLVVIGSGQGGVPLAVDQAEQGKQVVIFEKGSWGGSCINYGCTPSKAFLASAHAAQQVSAADQLGIKADPQVQFPEIMDRVRGIIESWSEGVEGRLANENLTRVEAAAAFQEPGVVAGGGETYRAEQVVVNTGKSPFIPPIDGLEDVPYLTYETFWELEEQPDQVLILGGGYTGVELGQGLARLGTEVHIFERNGRLVHREEGDVSQVLAEALREDGAALHFHTSAARVEEHGGAVRLETEDGEVFRGDALLVATGRKPNTRELKPEAGGVELDDRGHIQVDGHFQTTAEGVYAIGDVTGQPAFTHVSWEDYRRLSGIFAGENRTRGDRVLAYAFFTDPQVGRVGLTAEQAGQSGLSPRTETLPLDQVARALEIGKTRGFYRMVVDQETDRILGATLVGPEAAELVHILVAHINHDGTWQDLHQSMHIHPAFAEALPTLAGKFQSS
jgi:dihydrolipoamide dehydrogenase